MNIIPLSEGTFTIDKTKLFVPIDINAEDFQARAPGSLLVEIQPFVIKTSRDILLLDTGLGFSDNEGELQIHKNLDAAGIHVSDITKVLLTHLHKDHAGAVTDQRDRSILNFPQATYYIQQREFDYAFEIGTPSYLTEELKALKDSEKVVWLSDNEGWIDDYIHYLVTGAHSPLHQVFWIRDDEKIIFFGGDDAPQLQQMKHRFSAKYDHDGKKAMELRREWWTKGEEEKWTFLFYHDVKNPVFAF